MATNLALPNVCFWRIADLSRTDPSDPKADIGEIGYKRRNVICGGI